MPKTTSFKRKTDHFIETGCFHGNGIQLAINSGFNNIYSIELSEHFVDVCKGRFANDPRVSIIHGDSYYELEKLLKEHPEKQFTYWLDGHHCGDGTGFGVEEFPIMQELKTILERGVANEVIYIDDMRILRSLNSEVNQAKINELIIQYKPDATLSFEASTYDQEDIMIVEY